MTTADYALVVSLVSVAIAFASLLWNVWQKYIFVKPSLQVGFGVYTVFHPGNGKQLLNLTVTNMGPGPATVTVCTAKKARLPRWWPWHPGIGMLNPIHGDPLDPIPRSIGPYSAGLP